MQPNWAALILHQCVEHGKSQKKKIATFEIKMR
jgi:hypothetical protein